MRDFSLWVHEMSHMWSVYFSLKPVVDTRSPMPASAVQSFPRSRILNRHPYSGKDQYRQLYLEGDSGRQGFDSVLEELNAYVHSLAAGYCTRDLGDGLNRSDRDGVLTFMLYTELYLATARDDHPEVYQSLVEDADTVNLLRAVWQRAEYYLAVTKPFNYLGINDRAIAKHVYAPANRAQVTGLL